MSVTTITPTPRCGSFPCIYGMPLEIGVQVISVIDLVYSTASLMSFATLMGIDLFAHRKRSGSKNKTNPTPEKKKSTPPPYIDPFKTTTTTERAGWTLRTSSTEEPMYDYESEDIYILSSKYSKIALMTAHKHEYIEKNCGNNYLKDFLFTYELTKTKDIWNEFLWVRIFSETIYIGLSIVMLITVCCFIEYRGSKVVVMILWYLQWLPIFMDVYSIILSQTKRMCILEYAWAHRLFKGQSCMLWTVLCRILLFKMYQLLVLFYFIKEFLKDGYLKDESFRSGRNESDYHRSYFKEFYELEEKRGRNVDELKASDNINAMSFDDLDEIEVDSIQI